MTVDQPYVSFSHKCECELLPRVELGTSSLPRMRSTTELKQQQSAVHYYVSGKRGSNPRPPAWKASALSTELFPRAERSSLNGWVVMDSNHRSESQQIYSLPHLATLETTQLLHFLEPLVGLEPTTSRLQITCSTS